MISDEIKQKRLEMLSGVPAAAQRELKAYWAVTDAKDAVVDAALAAEPRLERLVKTEPGNLIAFLLESVVVLRKAQKVVAKL